MSRLNLRRGAASRHSPIVYHRRRAVLITGAVLAIWLAVQGAGSVAGWFGDDPSKPAGAAGPPTTEARSVEEEACPPATERFDEPTEEPPAGLTDALEVALSNRSFEVRDAGISVWMEGYGELATRNPDLPLAPASNQKILVGMGALELLDHDRRLVTELRATGPISPEGVLDGDLVIVGGGDPLIKKVGPHSVEDIADRLAEEGITRITGGIIGDESRYDQVRKAPGWLGWEMPLPAGSMSALMVNSNSRLGTPEYLANPTQHNVDLLHAALEEAGVEVLGEARPGRDPAGSELVLAYESPPIAEIVQLMLRESDNMTAEMLTKEVGLQVSGEGSTRAGMDAMIAALGHSLCIEITGVNDDASGVSRDNRRSARTWREMLLAARDAEWFDVFFDGLPRSGEEPGTLATRFLGTEAAGDVVAKTGTIGTAVALSGYLETDGGRDVVFSAVANGTDPEPAVAAIDALVVALAADRS